MCADCVMTFETVSIVRCCDYEHERLKEALLLALQPVGGLDWVAKGMRIGIKANLVSFHAPETAVTTHPAILCALTELLTERGASVVIGDSPGGLYNAMFVNRVYAAAKMHTTEQYGATLNHDFSEKEAIFPEAVQAKSFRYTAYLDQCDVILNVCKLKSHGMMGMSNAAKNMFGVIPGTIKPEYHYRYPNPNDFSDMIVDLNCYFKPYLSICDAVVAMEGNGPTQGTPVPMNCILASLSPHCLDLTAAHLIGMTAEDVPTLQAAKRRGLIPDSWEMLDVRGEPEQFVKPDFQVIRNHNSHLFVKGDSVFQKLKGTLYRACLSVRPEANKKECIGCKKCEQICPARAIVMKNGLPVIDKKACIKCFCCQEFCPKGAMKVKRTWVARFLNR